MKRERLSARVLAVAWLGCVSLAACTPEAGPAGGGSALEAGPAGDGAGAPDMADAQGAAHRSTVTAQAGASGDASEPGAHVDTLPLPRRLAFMSGHVAAGLALYRAGEPQMAASHLLHPVSETHAGERVGLDALGFDASLFETVSQALEAGRPASDIEPQLAQAEAHLAMLAQKAGGVPTDIISFLLEKIAEEYAVSITDGVVTDPAEYQDAYGFALVARQRAGALRETARPAVLDAIDTLIALWPQGPVPTPAPALVAQVLAQCSVVALALPPVE